MKAKRISRKAVKNMINGNTALLHIGNFDTGKRTGLKRAVSECVYTGRLYYNKELQSDNEKIEYLVYSQPYRVFMKHILQRLTPTPPLQPTVNKKPKPIANKFTTWFLTTIQQAIASI